MRSVSASLFPALQELRGKLRRTDARQRAPRRGLAGDAPGGLKEAQLHNPLLQPLLLVGAGSGGNFYAGDALGGSAAYGEGGGGGMELPSGGEGDNSGVAVLAVVDRPLVREKGQQALLYGVAVIMAPKNQLHLDNARFT